MIGPEIHSIKSNKKNKFTMVKTSKKFLFNKIQTTKVPAGKFLSFDHLNFWVGNAKQAATYYIARFGFQPFAYKGLETGSKDFVSHAVKQNNVKKNLILFSKNNFKKDNFCFYFSN